MKLKDLQIVSDQPFPSIENLVPNKQEARSLMDDYAGIVSETTASIQYMYQHYIVYETEPEIAEILEEIAISEMVHHEKLGKAIFMLGGDPIIAGTRGYWNGSVINYAKCTKTFLKNNIASEKLAIRNYKYTLTKITQESLKALIERIILDEQVHIETFTFLLEYLDAQKTE